MKADHTEKNIRIRPILSFSGTILIIVLGFFVWYNIPVKLLPRNADTITKINLWDGNTGQEVTFSDDEAIRFIVETLHDTYFKRSGLALGVGTSYRLSFISDNAIIKSRFVLQTGTEIKKGIFFYTLSDDTQDLVALSVYLEKILSWAQSGDMSFPAPPQNEDFQIPDLPTGESLQKTIP